MDFLLSFYPWIKTLHIMAVISWMAGMFYLPRLFVYHAERATVGSELSETLKVMEEKLYRVIMTPAMMVSWVAGLLMMVTPGVIYWSGSFWFYPKFLAVIAMTITHVWLGRRLRVFAADGNSLKGRTFRLINEIPTVLMLVIVIMAVVKPF